MSVKLSELLSKAADDVFERSYDCPIDESTAIRTRSRTLRSITPALVDVVAELQNHAEHGWHDHCDKTLCKACILASAMKEAGVTCG